MIRAVEKPFDEIAGLVRAHLEEGGAPRVLVAGCDTCVAICHAGGRKQADILATKLRLVLNNGTGSAAKPVEVTPTAVTRQCEKEFDSELATDMAGSGIVISIACGVGVQVLGEQYPDAKVVPGLNTLFMGAPVEPWLYVERCSGCGDCLLHLTGGLCPVARCAKSLFNGPCGGSMNGKCEVSNDIPCVWQEIIDKMRASGNAAGLERLIGVRDWSVSNNASPRRIVREELK